MILGFTKHSVLEAGLFLLSSVKVPTQLGLIEESGLSHWTLQKL